MTASFTHRKKRLTLWTLAVWAAQQQQQAMGYRQHYVPRSKREVLYHHVLKGQPRSGYLKKVQHSSTNDRHHIQNVYQQEHPEDGTFWVLDVTASGGSTRREEEGTRNRRRTRRLAQDDESSTSKLWRRLFEQFVGADLPSAGDRNTSFIDSSSGSGATNNVTTEVEFEAIVDPAANNSENTIADNNSNNSLPHNETTSAVHTGKNVTTVTGNATLAGNITESVVYTKPAQGTNSTIYSNNTDATDGTNSTEFKPLRLRAILVEDSGNQYSLLNETERNALFHDMLSPALLAWSSSLRVDPVVGNLTVDVSQLVDGETCGPGMNSGLPSIKVPLHHITQGIPETDMILYLSLGFAVKSNHSQDNTTSIYDDIDNTFNASDGGVEEDTVEDDLVVYEVDSSSRDGMGSRVKDILERADGGSVRRRTAWENNTSFDAEGDIYEDEDHTVAGGRRGPLSEFQDDSLNTTNATEPINICTGDYLAAASYCSSDQYDRPTAAMLHICIDNTFFDPKYLRRNILTIMHEIGHALGFNSVSMAHFRRPDGTPYTPRDKNGDVPLTKIECTGAETKHAYATVPLPSEEILQFREVRGGVRVAEIVTPSVLQVVRNQFDCQHLTGAELESGEGLPLSVQESEGCIGDHWERRLFSSDLMNPVVNDLEYSTRISTLTLAYFADSGWYQVDLSNAEVASGWGRGAGCSFVNDTCINESGEVPVQNAPFFCNKVPSQGLSMASNIHGCTPDLSRKATCSIGQYNLELPPAYQYFNSTYGADVGGSDTLMDFCPVYSGYDNGLCSNKENEASVKAFPLERFGQRNSRCLVGSVRPFFQPTALCLPIACVVQDHTLRIKVEDRWHVCERPSQRIVSGSLTIECPDPRRVCPTFFCPYDCLGTDGQCNYTSGNCMCEYSNSTNTTETVLDVCGLWEVANFVDEGHTLRPIIRPDDPEKGDPAMPPPDTKLSEYYVVNANSLEENPLLEVFAVALICITAVLVLSFIIYFILLRKRSDGDGPSPTTANFFGWFKNQGDLLQDNDDDGEMPVNPNKDKMVATVLVDMRIRNARRWPRLGSPNANESLASTEGQVTDSEAASGPESMSDMSSRRSETSDFDTSQNDIVVEEPLPDIFEEPQVIRRRRYFPDAHA